MQLPCHLFAPCARLGPGLRCAWLVLSGVLAGFLLGGLPAQAQAPVGQSKMLTEVGKWVEQTQQLAPEQFGFAPMDSRVQLQSCDRALLMDLPFASRETVRVRCLGPASWQLYLRIVLTPGLGPGLTTVAPVTSVAASPSSSMAATGRKVVVGKLLLRAGTIVTSDLLTEVEHSGQGLDSQVVSSVRDLENGEMVRDVPAGAPLRSHDVRRAVLVKRGQMILLSVGVSAVGGFAITARVEALQDGKMGEQVRLKNLESGRLLTGIVTGPNAARGL
jgi:flagella basal body P-ring formation protein FlgA